MMQDSLKESGQSNTVKVMFENGISRFMLSCDAIMEELADRLGRFAERHQGKPIAFDVKLGALSQ